MAGVDLSHRLGEALGTRTVTAAERAVVFDAAIAVDVWDELPGDVRRLVEQIEQRPGWVDAAKSI
jgi:hypothetical protein